MFVEENKVAQQNIEEPAKPNVLSQEKQQLEISIPPLLREIEAAEELKVRTVEEISRAAEPSTTATKPIVESNPFEDDVQDVKTKELPAFMRKLFKK
jgi:hypothetical protein